MTKEEIIMQFEQDCEIWETKVDEVEINKHHLIDLILQSLWIKHIFKESDIELDLIFAFRKARDNSYDIRLLKGINSNSVPIELKGNITLDKTSVNLSFGIYLDYYELKISSNKIIINEVLLENGKFVQSDIITDLKFLSSSYASIVRSRKDNEMRYE